MISINNCEQGTDEWFSARLGSVGASSMSKVLAKGQGKTRKTLLYQLAAEIITGEPTTPFSSDAMQRGIDLEDEARRLFEFQQDIDITQAGLVKNTDFSGCHCSPDGLIISDFEIVGGLEIKCPLPATHIAYLESGKLPSAYKAQVQASMMVCSVYSWWFMSHCPGIKPLIIEVEIDHKYVGNMAIESQRFTADLAAMIAKINN